MKTNFDLQLEYKRETGFRWFEKDEDYNEIPTQNYLNWLEEKLLEFKNRVKKSKKQKVLC